MTTHGFSQFVLNNRVQASADVVDVVAAKDVAQLISGSLIYRLYESLVEHDYDMDVVTEHLEMLFDTENHYGLLYFIFILSDATDEALPDRFEGMLINPSLVPYLSGAIIEDWLDFHDDYEN